MPQPEGLARKDNDSCIILPRSSLTQNSSNLDLGGAEVGRPESKSTARLLARLYVWFRTLPIVDFYSYMFRKNKPLFFGTLGANYLLPLMLEVMPWFLSLTKLSRLIRDLRNSLTHRVMTSQSFVFSAVTNFVLLNIIFVSLQTLVDLIQNRVQVGVNFCGMHNS